MRELKISLLRGVKIDKVRKATDEEKAQYIERQKRKAKEAGKEFDKNTSFQEYIIQATQSYVREKDGRLIHSPLDIRSDLKLEENSIYDIYASWVVEVQGVNLLKADIAHKVEAKKDGK